MENTPAKIRVSLREGLLEIEGSEEFVSKQIENLKDVIIKFPSSGLPPNTSPARPPAGEGGNGQPLTGAPLNRTDEASKYVNVISVDSNVVKILKDIPGANDSQKMVNAALLFLFGKSLIGQDEAPFKELRQVCKDHGCLDEANFSAKLKAQREWINVIGSGKSKIAKLTVPGKKQAQSLADQLNPS